MTYRNFLNTLTSYSIIKIKLYKLFFMDPKE